MKPRAYLLAALLTLLAIGFLRVPASADAATWSAGSISFGKVKVGTLGSPRLVEVRTNQRCTPIQPQHFDCQYEQLDLAVSGPFEITSQNCTIPPIQRPCQIYLRFIPKQRGEQQGFLRLTSREIFNPTPIIQGAPLVGVGCERAKGKRRKGKLRCRP